MLTPDQAKEMLKPVQIEAEHERRLTVLASLPEPFVIPARLLFIEDKVEHSWETRSQRMIEAAGLLDQLSIEDRHRFFEALFPGLSHDVEAAWQIQITRLPYQRGSQRRAFRAPDRPELSREARGQWLFSLFSTLASYQQDITWIAVWSGYLRQNGTAAPELAVLLAAVAEADTPTGDAVFNILLASARGDHEIGVMGRHVIRALLMASRPEGWVFVEKLLLAAQRQEGLRQVILESVDEAHPVAFGRMVRLVLDHDLLRFSATVRAVDVWFGMSWTVEHVRTIEAFLKRLVGFLDHPAEREAALHGDAEGLYIALWLTAFEDVTTAIDMAKSLLVDPGPERRFVAVHFMGQVALPEARRIVLPLLSDPDLRIVGRALQVTLPNRWARTMVHSDNSDLFEHLEQLLTRLKPSDQATKPILWPWLVFDIERERVADSLIGALENRSPKRLIPYLSEMSAYGREKMPNMLMHGDKSDPDIRQTLFALLSDQSQSVREKTLKAIADLTVTDQEIVELETLLYRKAGDLRRAVLSILIHRDDAQVFESVERLLGTKTPLERSAGIELLRLLMEDGRQRERCATRAAAFRSSQPRLSEDEEALLNAILKKEETTPTLDNALGLLDPTQQTPPIRPTPKERLYISDAAIACVVSLDALIEAHSRVPVVYSRWSNHQEEALLGNIQYGIDPNVKTSLEQDLVRLPLREVWEQWWADRPAEQRDLDGLELVRALALAPLRVIVKRVEDASVKRVAEVALNNGDWEGPLKYPQLIRTFLHWLIRLHPPVGIADFLLDAAETVYSLIPDEDLGRFTIPDKNRPYDTPDLWWRRSDAVTVWLGQSCYCRDLCPETWTGEHDTRLWRLHRWDDAPGVEARRARPELEEILAAFNVGAATDADIIDYLLGPREVSNRWGGFQMLARLSGRRPHPWFALYPGLETIVDRCRKRIVEVETRRGEMPSASSEAAKQLRAVYGIDTLFALLKNLGKQDFQRGWSSNDGLSKQVVLSHLIRVTFPTETDTADAFAKQVITAKISQKRLIDLALYAPHWARFVEHKLGWKGLEDAVWWIHAHTKDRHWSVDREITELWTAEISERTPLTAQDLLDGAVDVAWFFRVYKTLGNEHWDALYNSAKYASGGQGSERAKLFSDAMLGKIEPQALVDRVTNKRHQDALRALGLLPLAKGAKKQTDVLDRYRWIQEFLRTGKAFGSQRRASEKLATGIAMQNLARTAGYSDPMRLEWAMEARANTDLAGGSLSQTVNNITITLTVDPWGEASIAVDKQGKPLKTIPPKLKKDPQIVQLLERKQDIKKQIARMRQSLEQAMCDGSEFSADELRSLMAHPILAPMLEHLLFVGHSIMGYPTQDGNALQHYDGTTLSIPKKTMLRIAHPYDLLMSGHWHEWQHECFIAEHIQPFKQIYRELYVLTEAEKAEGDRSLRYAGHQVQPKQAAALLAQRGWVIQPEAGARRTFFNENLSAWASGLSGFFTPTEVEGETLEALHFSRRGEWSSVALKDIPPHVFSETMRDLDLVVSVAHVGGVDPEASASTVEMRATLLQETCTLLKINNVRIVSSHILIDGKLGNYSVHLGSGVVHRQPGGAVCIIPVHSQHRGRIFLPFADDDPRTAEVVSKTILLARDHEIKDPTILEQLLIRH